jgi:energy-coupling factor transporter ATP-binding protein EcfA2
VLDEAWTGLDQAARVTLDAAVTERVAAGGAVLFVDHDPARLAGLEDERWSFDGAGGVTVLAGPAPVPTAPVPTAPVPTAPVPTAPVPAGVVERVTIRLETTDAARVIRQVRAIDGARVITADVDGVDAGGRDA